jgi:uncharacterized RDD family membrane protein YckC
MQSILLRRAGAYVIDIVILFVVLAPLGYLVQRALGVSPGTAQGVYATLVLNFSLPTWTYFALGDHSRCGATFGKRMLSLRTEAAVDGRVGGGQALARTVVKMFPWEMAHASVFLFAPALGVFAVGNWIGLAASYVLSFAYLIVAWRTQGHRSVHDFVASTSVRPVSMPPGATAP